MFDFLTFDAISASALDFFEVLQVPIAVLVGLGIATMVAGGLLSLMGFGDGGGEVGGGGGGGGGGPGLPAKRHKLSRRDKRKLRSDREWAMLEQHARDVNDWDG